MTTLPADPYSTKAPPDGQDDGDSDRIQRGLAIAAKVRLKRNQQGWTVPSQSGNGSYYTTIDFCTCPDYELRARPCKHIYAVRFVSAREENGDPNVQPVVKHDAGKVSKGVRSNPPNKAQAQGLDLWVPTASASQSISLLDDQSGASIIVPSEADVCLDAESHHLITGTGYDSLSGPGIVAINGASLIVPSGGSVRDWAAYDDAKETESEKFKLILEDVCKCLPEREQAMGRRAWPWAKVVKYICWKVYLTKGWRDSVDKSQRGQCDYGPRENPCWSALAKYTQSTELTEVLTTLIEHSASPFRSIEEVFAVDSTGFSTSVVENWNTYRYGNDVRSQGEPDHPLRRRRNSKRTLFVKAHICCGVRSNVVTAVFVTPTDSGDAPQLPMLVARTAKRFRMKEVLADKAYLAQYNLNAIHEVGAVPFIPMKSNSLLHEGDDNDTKLWNGLYHFFGSHRDDFLSHYHQRSNVETTMSMVKTKFGEHVRARHSVARVNEVLAKILCHNVCQLHRLTAEFGYSFSWT